MSEDDVRIFDFVAVLMVRILDLGGRSVPFGKLKGFEPGRQSSLQTSPRCLSGKLSDLELDFLRRAESLSMSFCSSLKTGSSTLSCVIAILCRTALMCPDTSNRCWGWGQPLCTWSEPFRSWWQRGESLRLEAQQKSSAQMCSSHMEAKWQKLPLASLDKI